MPAVAIDTTSTPKVKPSQMQTLLRLSGIMLTSNGAVIAVRARAARPL